MSLDEEDRERKHRLARVTGPIDKRYDSEKVQRKDILEVKGPIVGYSTALIGKLAKTADRIWQVSRIIFLD